MSTNTLYLGSKNPGKLREYRRLLALKSWSISEVTTVEEPEEIGDSFEGIANLKARYYAKAMNGLAVAEDAGLVVPALSGSPGIYSARFADCELDPNTFAVLGYSASGRSRNEMDAANNQRLLKLLSSLDDDKRKAHYVVHIAVSNATEEILYSKPFHFEGKIAKQSGGENGFGYDFIFEPNATPGKLTSELEPQQKDALSHRGKGIVDLKKFLSGF